MSLQNTMRNLSSQISNARSRRPSSSGYTNPQSVGGGGYVPRGVTQVNDTPQPTRMAPRSPSGMTPGSQRPTPGPRRPSGRQMYLDNIARRRAAQRNANG
jgi:hypothetical protein